MDLQTAKTSRLQGTQGGARLLLHQIKMQSLGRSEASMSGRLVRRFPRGEGGGKRCYVTSATTSKMSTSEASKFKSMPLLRQASSHLLSGSYLQLQLSPCATSTARSHFNSVTPKFLYLAEKLRKPQNTRAAFVEFTSG